MKPTAVCDVECYRDYFLIMFRDVADRSRTRAFELFDGQELDIDGVRRMLIRCRVVTFNGINYDMLMIAAALRGWSNMKLKELSDSIIKGQLKSWQTEELFGLRVSDKIDHIDLIEVAPGVMVSLKLYGGRLHSKRLQDLPIPEDASILPEQRPLMRSYCGNDLDTTIDLWEKLTTGDDDVIGIRERIGAEVGIDVRSKSDAQMAEAVIKILVERMMKERVYKPDVPAGTRFKYKPPAFLQFRSALMRSKLEEICQADFIVQPNGQVAEPVVLEDAGVAIGNSVYRMGIGGLHSSEVSTTHVADAGTILVDRDVVSFYPMLIKQCGLSPRNMGTHFQKVFCDFIDRRITAKKAGHKTAAQTLKIYLNGTFGKLGSPYSIVYAPDLLIQVTLTGQLVLLMMIERMEAAGIPVVSANTDGIVIKCPTSMQQTMLDIVAQWERETGFETEETRYRALCSRDINNYIALKEKGGYKAKGAYAPPGLQKNPTRDICNDAVAAFLEKGTPIAQTIVDCKDVRKFLTVRTVKGGGVVITRTVFDDTLTKAKKRPYLLAAGWMQFDRDEWVPPGPADSAVLDTDTAYRRMCGEDEFSYLGKVVRWVYRRGETRGIHYKEKNKSGNRNKVPDSDGALPLMELPDAVPADIDYARYIAISHGILNDLGALHE